MERVMAVQQQQLASLIASLIRPSNVTAYATGGTVSAVTTNAHLTFASAAQKAPGLMGGVIVGARIVSNANVATKPDLELWLFRTDIAAVADQTQFAPTDAEANTIIGVIPFPVASWRQASGSGVNSMCEWAPPTLGLPFRLGTPVTPSIFGQLVIRNAYVPVSAETFQVELMVQQN